MHFSCDFFMDSLVVLSSVCMEKVPKGSNVKNWSSQEMNGYIFIWYHTDPTEIPWELPLSTEELKTKYFYHGHNEFYIHCHIQEIPENGSDIAHFNAIHKESLIDGIWATKKFSFNRCGYHHWKARWFPTPGKLKHLAEVHLNHTLELFGKIYCFRMDVCGKQIGPSYVCLEINSLTFGELKIFQYITPIEPLLQKVVHQFYGPRWMGPLMKIFIYGESLMFERDINIWNNKIFNRNPILAKEDASIKKFRIWFSQFYTSNSKPYSEVNAGWWFPTPAKLKHLAEVHLHHTLELFGKFYIFRMDVCGKQIGPSYVCLEINSLTFGELKLFQYITPIEPLLQKVLHQFYGPRWMGPLMKIFIYGESLMIKKIFKPVPLIRN
ncbi:cholesterol 7-desaturase nvd [Drosophila suzukii]|uniref:Cholesterol 7-desaturase nvd n=1 Tax=Drosophila suzukii TaxID=28584 RepID=A0ABM4TP59_DROSZ